MEPPDAPRTFLMAAKKDLLAASNMQNPDQFPTEVFGFHVQQAIEKGLKSLLEANGIPFSRTHNLRFLVGLAEQNNLLPNVDSARVFIPLNAFAVQYRYEAIDAGNDPIDRKYWVEKATDFIGFIENSVDGFR
jgi:HEPN domain-containing protein